MDTLKHRSCAGLKMHDIELLMKHGILYLIYVFENLKQQATKLAIFQTL